MVRRTGLKGRLGLLRLPSVPRNSRYPVAGCRRGYSWSRSTVRISVTVGDVPLESLLEKAIRNVGDRRRRISEAFVLFAHGVDDASALDAGPEDLERVLDLARMLARLGQALVCSPTARAVFGGIVAGGEKGGPEADPPSGSPTSG